MSDTILYDYWRSTASYRVRIALNLANIPYQSIPIDLVAGEHRSSEHLVRNPQGLVPVLQIDDQRFTQSLAIIDYLDATRNLGLLPPNPILRTKVQALAQAIAIDLHPVCNLGVVKHATQGEEPARTQWMQHFITPGLAAFDTLLAEFEQIPFCAGSTPGLADICLVPQLYNAQRWGADYSGCSRIMQVAEACREHPAFMTAHPDAVKP